jgi:[ribosomal protein S5]-alanine N-acetyltransferase
VQQGREEVLRWVGDPTGQGGPGDIAYDIWVERAMPSGYPGLVDGILLETERLRLRPFREDDVDDLFAVLGDAETMRYYPEPFTRDGVVGWIENYITRYWRDGFGLLAMELKDTGELVGDCGPAVREVEGEREVELAWHVKRAQWGRGLAPEAALVCRDWAFDHVGPRLISLIRPENIQSIRVAEKIGMKPERRTTYGSEGWLHVVYAISKANPVMAEQ